MSPSSHQGLIEQGQLWLDCALIVEADSMEVEQSQIPEVWCLPTMWASACLPSPQPP